MTIIIACESEVLADHDPMKLSGFASMLSKRVLRDTNVTAVLKLVDHYRKKIDSAY